MVGHVIEQLSRIQVLDNLLAEKDKGGSAAKLHMELQAESSEAKGQRDKLDGQLAEIALQKRKVMAALEMNAERVERIEAQSSLVKNPSQYQALTKESDQLAKLKQQLEEKKAALIDAEIKLTEERDLEHKKMLQKEAACVEVDAKREAEVLDARPKWDALQRERDKLAEQLGRSTMGLYTRIRGQRQQALVAADQGRCTACHMSLPPQMYIRLQKLEALERCPGCQRFLFVESAVG